MKRHSYFDVYDGPGWPPLAELERYFIAPKGKEWSYKGGNDNWGLKADGADGTENLEVNKGRIDIRLNMWGHPDHGVLLIYSKYGGGSQQTYSSRGDLSRLREWVRTLQGDPMPIGLFIPFSKAWKAVKEFIQTDGQLPKSIEWIANSNLPPNTFPAPHEVEI
ncbi:MAG: Imm1 family immunity protein [Xanthobacteraceae bacterium]